jgi:hypothetical protein
MLFGKNSNNYNDKKHQNSTNDIKKHGSYQIGSMSYHIGSFIKFDITLLIFYSEFYPTNSI